MGCFVFFPLNNSFKKCTKQEQTHAIILHIDCWCMMGQKRTLHLLVSDFFLENCVLKRKPIFKKNNSDSLFMNFLHISISPQNFCTFLYIRSSYLLQGFYNYFLTHVPQISHFLKSPI